MIYPQKFQVLYPNEESLEAATHIWGKVLNDIEDGVIAKALDDVAKKFTWMPEVAEFRQLCLLFRNMSENYFYSTPSRLYEKRAPLPSPLLQDYMRKQREIK